jgi:hypothetical protein
MMISELGISLAYSQSITGLHKRGILSRRLLFIKPCFPCNSFNKSANFSDTDKELDFS